jgi:hypothetical protein
MATKVSPGTLRLSAEVSCGCCQGWWVALVGSRREAARLVRRRGWVFVQGTGWICARCARVAWRLPPREFS